MQSDTEFDATAVLALARRVRGFSVALADADADLAGMPDALHAPLRSVASGLPVERHADAVRTMASYCGELEVIADSLVTLDERRLELDGQVACWAQRIAQLEAQKRGAAGGTAADHVVREISLLLGRISGAQSMTRHYAHERDGLAARYEVAHRRCSSALASLLT